MTDIKTITNLKELEERKELQLDDIVIFTIKKEILKYYVYSKFLNHDVHNNRIFDILELNKNDKDKLAEKIYGYEINSGDWPESKKNDFPALTRLVKELYLIIEKREKVYTKFTRFEIMEI